ncbi:MAG: PDZ domain-containing protein [Ardenticatenaceae bacterium]|nr:PDZ domain-containing protein [Ardenticatenaceae bacterium]MCB9446582.1 PDZ domain-containing protein [Ardenticatenaceae bacterium]
MSDRLRNLLAVFLLITLAISAFVAGYFMNDFVELRSGGTLVRDQSDFDLFWEAWGRVQGTFIGEIPSSKAMTYGAIRGAIALLNDPYTVFVEPVARQQEIQSLQGTFGGIGAFLSRPEEGGDILLEPMPGNPAEAAGVRSQDVLLAVDGAPITPEMTVSEVADLIKGDIGTVVVLTVRHADETEPVDISITRDRILDPSVSSRLLAEDETIGYIRLTRFSAESSTEVKDAITSLLDQGAQSLILDMRHNGGGLLDAAVDIADHFLTDGPILYQQSKDEGERVYSATAETIAPDIPLVVLVDGGTASAAEIVAGALQDRGRAIMIGSSPTFGKGSVQLVFDLSDGSSVHVTSARWYTPDHHQIDQQGLTPEIIVEVTQEAIDNGIDQVLLRAVEELQNGNK